MFGMESNIYKRLTLEIHLIHKINYLINKKAMSTRICYLKEYHRAFQLVVVSLVGNTPGVKYLGFLII